MKRFEAERMQKLNQEEAKRVSKAVDDLKSHENHDRSTTKLQKSEAGRSREGLPIMKFDAESGSCVTFNTDTSSMFHNPSSLNTYASSKMEMQLNFLAKQLELEKQRREKLQK